MSKRIEEQQPVMEVFDTLARAHFDENQPHVDLLAQPANTRLLLFSFKAGQMLKEHQAPRSILVQTLQGNVQFRTADSDVMLRPGMILQLAANISHNVLAQTDAIVLVTRL